MLSARITYLRKSQGMSQSQLASKLSISASAVGMYEQGRRVPDLGTLIAISDLFDVSLDYLITGEEHQHLHKDQRPALNFPCSSCFWREYREK